MGIVEWRAKWGDNPQEPALPDVLGEERAQVSTRNIRAQYGHLLDVTQKQFFN